MPSHDPEVFRIGSFLLTPARRELSLGENVVPLGSRAFDLLIALVKRRGQLATKHDLMAEVWPGIAVEDNNLAAQISALRKVLSADPSIARDLQTVPGRGYRLVAKIELLEGDTGPRASRARARFGETPTLIVLPFVNLSSNAQQGYFAQGLSQTISTDLSRIAGLLVISAATASTFEGKNVDVRQVSRELGARYVLTGTVHRIRRNVRINAQLVDGETGFQLWADLFDGYATELHSLQDRITGRIANSIGRTIFSAAASDQVMRNVDPTASDLVMRGIAADVRPQSRDVLQHQEDLFARAAELDPGNSDALARLSRAIVLQATQAHASSPKMANALARGVSAAERAIAADPRNPVAHFAMGLVHVLRRDFARSVRANEAAIALDRNFALAHNNLGNSWVHLGEGKAALRAIETALRLDPLGPQLGASCTVLGFTRLLLGQVEESVECFSRARAANPMLPRAHAGAAISLALSGDLRGARTAAGDLLELAPHYRLSETIDACLPTSPAQYRDFYERILCPGANLAGLPM